MRRQKTKSLLDPSLADYAPPVSPIASYILQTMLTLVGVVVLAWIILYATRRLGGPTSGGPLRLLGRLPLDGRRAIYLVKVADQYLVVGSSEAGISKLAELEDLPETFDAPPGRRRFKDVFSGLTEPERSPDSPPQEDGSVAASLEPQDPRA